MATAESIKSLIRSHLSEDDERFYTLALQVAAHEAHQGHGALAHDIREIIDKARRTRGSNTLLKFPQDLAGLVLSQNSDLSLSTLVLPEPLKERIQRVIHEFRQQAKLKKHGMSNRRKLLLTGPPGTGKTMTARILSHELRLPSTRSRWTSSSPRNPSSPTSQRSKPQACSGHSGKESRPTRASDPWPSSAFPSCFCQVHWTPVTTTAIPGAAEKAPGSGISRSPLDRASLKNYSHEHSSMMLYKRQKLLLDLVHAAGGELAATDLQKLLFLYVRQCEAEPSYQFVPYRFGCFSFQSYADRATLQHKGMIFESDESSWKLTPKAKPYLDSKRKAALTHFLTRVVPERGNDLVRRIYRLHPYYAINSEILDRVLPDKEDQKAIQSARPANLGQALFTIGYEGDSVDGYLERLIRHGVKVLCDVRRNPLSRKAL